MIVVEGKENDRDTQEIRNENYKDGQKLIDHLFQ